MCWPSWHLHIESLQGHAKHGEETGQAWHTDTEIDARGWGCGTTTMITIQWEASLHIEEPTGSQSNSLTQHNSCSIRCAHPHVTIWILPHMYTPPMGVDGRCYNSHFHNQQFLFNPLDLLNKRLVNVFELLWADLMYQLSCQETRSSSTKRHKLSSVFFSIANWTKQTISFFRYILKLTLECNFHINEAMKGCFYRSERKSTHYFSLSFGQKSLWNNCSIRGSNPGKRLWWIVNTNSRDGPSDSVFPVFIGNTRE